MGSDAKIRAGTGKSLGTMGSYGALYPDGSKYLTTTGLLPVGHWAARGPLPPDPPGTTVTYSFPRAPGAATLMDTQTGVVVPDTGIPEGAAMPMFSPDGRHLVFYDQQPGNSGGLAVMDYDTRSHKASDYKVLVPPDASSPTRPGWPAFLPDSNAVIFARTESPDFSGYGGFGISAAANTTNSMGGSSVDAGVHAANSPSDLYIADVSTGTVTLLAKAMGFNRPEDATTGTTYLPFGEEDLHHNEFPTVSPVAAGGYFWVFFDSLRHFGSLGVTQVLWGTAIEIHADGRYTVDPSNPPFYLPGQEFIATDNKRAFAALDRCNPDGSPCSMGIDCCGGSCSAGLCAVPPPDSCAMLDERCTQQTDCCDPSLYCINSVCAFVPLL